MRILGLLGLMGLLFCGCARLYSVTDTTTADGMTVRTKVSSYTLWDSQSALTKFQNRGATTHSNEWAPGTTIGSVSQSSSSTNINDLAGTVVGAAVRAAVRP
jgi:hypothetical protein